LQHPKLAHFCPSRPLDKARTANFYLINLIAMRGLRVQVVLFPNWMSSPKFVKSFEWWKKGGLPDLAEETVFGHSLNAAS
jgi:hypothetical protein